MKKVKELILDREKLQKNEEDFILIYEVRTRILIENKNNQQKYSVWSKDNATLKTYFVCESNSLEKYTLKKVDIVKYRDGIVVNGEKNLNEIFVDNNWVPVREDKTIINIDCSEQVIFQYSNKENEETIFSDDIIDNDKLKLISVQLIIN